MTSSLMNRISLVATLIYDLSFTARVGPRRRQDTLSTMCLCMCVCEEKFLLVFHPHSISFSWNGDFQFSTTFHHNGGPQEKMNVTRCCYLPLSSGRFMCGNISKVSVRTRARCPLIEGWTVAKVQIQTHKSFGHRRVYPEGVDSAEHVPPSELDDDGHPSLSKLAH